MRPGLKSSLDLGDVPTAGEVTAFSETRLVAEAGGSVVAGSSCECSGTFAGLNQFRCDQRNPAVTASPSASNAGAVRRRFGRVSRIPGLAPGEAASVDTSGSRPGPALATASKVVLCPQCGHLTAKPSP